MHDDTAWPFNPVGWGLLHPEPAITGRLTVSFLPPRATCLFALALTTPHAL